MIAVPALRDLFIWNRAVKDQYLFAQQRARLLSAMIDYAAVLSARGEQNAVLDTRDLAIEMLYFWRDSIYHTYEKGRAESPV